MKKKTIKRIKGDLILTLVYLTIITLYVSSMSCVVVIDLPKKAIEDLRKEVVDSNEVEDEMVPTLEYIDVEELDSAVLNTKLTREIKPLSKNDSLRDIVQNMISQPDTVSFEKAKAIDFPFYVEDNEQYSDSLYSGMYNVRKQAQEFLTTEIQKRHPNRKILYKKIEADELLGKRLVHAVFNTEKYSIPVAYYITEFEPDHPAGNGKYKYIVTFVYDYIAYR